MSLYINAYPYTQPPVRDTGRHVRNLPEWLRLARRGPVSALPTLPAPGMPRAVGGAQETRRALPDVQAAAPAAGADSEARRL